MEFTVTEKAMRPASKERRCFYCRRAIGEYHKADCVLVKKTVKVRAVIEYEVEVPHAWNKHDVEFHRNDSSWCSGNMIGELQEIEADGCLCNITKWECLELNEEPILKET